jgi:hypothetical protein
VKKVYCTPVITTSGVISATQKSTPGYVEPDNLTSKVACLGFGL